MKIQPKKGKIKSIITITILIILLLLLIFSEDIVKLQNKNKVGLLENTAQAGYTTTIGDKTYDITNVIAENANIPTISAGMIPVKYDGTYWEITTKNDAEWYDYVSGKPAYMMLNDGVYQSELIRDMEGKKLVEENIGAQIQDSELGTIFMWIPRFEINEDSEEIKYIKDVGIAEEGWKIPELFMYKQKLETAPDFLLTGVWVEKEVDTSYSSKITEMNKEDGIYGFIANTKITQITLDEITSLQMYVNNYAYSNIITEADNLSRIILKIINDNNQDPIKAKGEYNKDTGIITVQVTYSKYGIKQILLEQTQELTFTKSNGIVTVDIIDIEDGKYTITIIDNNANKKKLKIQVISKLYAVLYTDGTLAFGKTEKLLSSKNVSVNYGDISDKETGWAPLWYSKRSTITTVEFVNKIKPVSTAYWFYNCSKLTTINNINKLDTSNVTNMAWMFSNCSGLTSLNLSNFDTSNVTTMWGIFYGCSGLTSLDVGNFDTSNVTDMSNMFCGCSGLTSIDVSNFDTSNVTDMGSMFRECSGLTSLDVSNFDTSNVTTMWGIFYGCSGLTSLDVSNFDTSNVTDMSNMFCGCSGLTSLDVSNFDTSNVTYMGSMFGGCSGLTSLDVSNFDTRNVTDMKMMFRECSGLTSIDVSNFDTSNVTDMSCMFYYCTGLTSLDISNFDTRNVTDMSCMFYYCTGLTSLDVSSFDTRNVTNMYAMFSGCSGLTSIDVSNFDTSNVTDMGSMFGGCSGLTSLDVSNFDTRNVTDMRYMFEYCSKLKTIYVGKNWSTLKADTDGMFAGCGTSSLTKK